MKRKPQTYAVDYSLKGYNRTRYFMDKERAKKFGNTRIKSKIRKL